MYLNNKKIRVVCWLLLLLTVSFLFKFNVRGNYCDNSVSIIIAFTFILTWFLTSIYAGYKKYHDILLAALIYSALPFFTLTQSKLFDGYLLYLFMLGCIWTFPLQGLYCNEIVVRIIPFTQLGLLIIGYVIGYVIDFKKKYNENKRISKCNQT